MAEKRYFVFSGDNYYPCGGMEDFHSSHATRLEAFQVAYRLLSGEGSEFGWRRDWVQIWDSEHDAPDSYSAFHRDSLDHLHEKIVTEETES